MKSFPPVEAEKSVTKIYTLNLSKSARYTGKWMSDRSENVSYGTTHHVEAVYQKLDGAIHGWPMSPL